MRYALGRRCFTTLPSSEMMAQPFRSSTLSQHHYFHKNWYQGLYSYVDGQASIVYNTGIVLYGKKWISAWINTPHLCRTAANSKIPANTPPRTNAGLILVQRRRRWANIKPVLVQGVVLAGNCSLKMAVLLHLSFICLFYCSMFCFVQQTYY